MLVEYLKCPNNQKLFIHIHLNGVYHLFCVCERLKFVQWTMLCFFSHFVIIFFFFCIRVEWLRIIALRGRADHRQGRILTSFVNLLQGWYKPTGDLMFAAVSLITRQRGKFNQMGGLGLIQPVISLQKWAKATGEQLSTENSPCTQSVMP
jgi:hypothetical protein